MRFSDPYLTRWLTQVYLTTIQMKNELAKADKRKIQIFFSVFPQHREKLAAFSGKLQIATRYNCTTNLIRK